MNPVLYSVPMNPVLYSEPIKLFPLFILNPM